MAKLTEEYIGKYIYVEDEGGTFWMIGKVAEKYHIEKESSGHCHRGMARYVSKSQNTDNITGDSLWSYGGAGAERQWRLATENEIAYCEACFKAGDYLDKKEFMLNYNSTPLIFN